jgi:hypothetical protein
MNRMRTTVLSIALLMAVVTAPAFAQYQTAPQSSDKPAAAVSAKIEDISNWTKKQWYAAKAKWVKEKAKWADCQKQAADKKLSGRKSWPFLYGCMTKSS